MASASIKMSASWVSSTRRMRSSTQALASVKNSSAFFSRMSSGSTRMIRKPAKLQVTILPSSSRVITPFDMLSSMLSL